MFHLSRILLLGLAFSPLTAFSKSFGMHGHRLPHKHHSRQSSTPVNRRDCTYVPPTADPDVVNTVFSICMEREVTGRVLLATFETAWVESRFNDLDCGDQDSVGVFQQRPSQGWGTVAQIENVTYSANAFLDICISHDSNPAYANYSAGQLAQSVQISEFPDHYDLAQPTAQQLLIQAQSAWNSANPTDTSNIIFVTLDVTTTTTATATATATATVVVTSTVTVTAAPTTKATTTTSTKKATTTSTTTSKASTAPTSAAVPSPLASGTIKVGCQTYHKIATGDKCSTLEPKYGVTEKQLQFWNPSINSSCGNLKVGTNYCVKSVTVPPPSTVASGTITTGCTQYYTAVKGDTCSTLDKNFHLSTATLEKWNTGVKSCSGIVAGKSYCVAAVV